MDTVTLRGAVLDDAPALAAIYAPYVTDTATLVRADSTHQPADGGPDDQLSTVAVVGRGC